jgi:type III pantothenate kinase
MLLALDIGNSNIVLGIYDQGHWRNIWRFPTLLSENPLLFYQDKISAQFLEHGLVSTDISQVIISSVVPELSASFTLLSEESLGQTPILLGPGLYERLSLKVEGANELGTDLYANATAAFHLFKQDCIIVDFGTALTFTIVNQQGELLGVNIAPGLKTAIHALFMKTAQLPEVPLVFPKSVVGKNTTHAIQSGVLVGYVGLVQHMVQAIQAELGATFQPIATGGLLTVLEPLHPFFFAIQPNLTLDGLRIIAKQVVDRN